jgi:type IV pilus assembly protein PilB
VAVIRFQDEWLSATLEELLGAEQVEAIRGGENPGETLWAAVVSQGKATDEQIVSALATRFRLKLADLTQSDRHARELVTEQVARRYRVLPLRVTDSYLEIAAANPFDLDCEKTLAFATGREVRVNLASPAKIQEKIDEFYRPENVIDTLLEGMRSSAEITTLQEGSPPPRLRNGRWCGWWT